MSEDFADGVRYDVSDGVALVTLDRPGVLNALDLAAGRRYNDLLRRADADPAVRVVLIRGAGRVFCSGADLSAMTGTDSAESATPEERLPADGLQPDLAHRIDKPVIAVVHGAAIGAGLVLALYADVRFLATDVKLDLGFPRLGLVAEYGMAWWLPRLAGLATATELLLSGRRFGAEEARAMGLAHAVHPPGEVHDAALDYATEIARSCAPHSVAAIKQQLRAAAGGGLDDALADARRRMLAALAGPDLAEGFAARAEGRLPSFRQWAGGNG